MRLGSDHVRVRVPATSANLGPGFDALGLALGVEDEIEVQAVGSPGAHVEVTGECAAEVGTGEDHLVVRALRAALDEVGAPQVGVRMRCVNRVPHGRGMGSSAAAVVGGVLAARMLIADPDALDDVTALRVATRLEGHPDNAAPALLGGATVAWTTDDGARAASLALHPDVVPVVLVPTTRLATRTARGVLPATVPHGDAAFTAGRAALLVHALGREPDLLFDATADRLHQDHRSGVMPETWELVRALRGAGQAAVVSGAGPSVLVLDRASAGDRSREAREQLLAELPGWVELRPGVGRGASAERC